MKKDYRVGLMVVIGLVLLDQATKWIASATIALGAKHTVIPGLVYLTHHLNDGMAWGLLAGARTFFIAITIAALGLFLYLAKDVDFKTKRLHSYGLALIIAGALGNFIDRIRTGLVVDFIGFVPLDLISGWLSGRVFPSFNVADMALVFGMIFFAIDELFFEPKRKRA